MFLLWVKRKLYFLKWAYAFFSTSSVKINIHNKLTQMYLFQMKKKKAPILAQKQRNEYLTEFVPIQQ